MTEFTVHFQKGTRVGTRALRMIRVVATNVKHAIKLAKAEFNGAHAVGFKLTRVDRFDDETGRLVREF